MKFTRQKNAQAPALTERELLEQKYRLARNNLLIIVAFSLINVLLLLFGSESYMLFSAVVPYYLVIYGMMFTGNVPESWGWGDVSDMLIFDQSVYVVVIILAMMCIAFYALFWFFSRKVSTGWMIAALVFISVDTLGMFLFVGFDVSMILDLLIHIWMIYEMSVGVITAQKLKKLPPEEVPLEVNPLADFEQTLEPTDSEQ